MLYVYPHLSFSRIYLFFRTSPRETMDRGSTVYIRVHIYYNFQLKIKESVLTLFFLLSIPENVQQMVTENHRERHNRN